MWTSCQARSERSEALLNLKNLALRRARLMGDRRCACIARVDFAAAPAAPAAIAARALAAAVVRARVRIRVSTVPGARSAAIGRAEIAAALALRQTGRCRAEEQHQRHDDFCHGSLS